MKKVLILTVLALCSTVLLAQENAIDQLIKKYSGQEGVTVVNIGPELFQMVSSMGVTELDDADFPVDKVSSLQVLTIEDNEELAGVDFYAELKDKLDLEDFKEVMTVMDGDEEVRMWMKVDGKNINRFLLIVSGDEPVLVNISGNFNMDDLDDITEGMDLDVDLDA